MLRTVDSNNKVNPFKNYSNFRDELLLDYYNNYFEHLSSRQLDKEYNNDLSIMVNLFKKMPQEKRSVLVNSISKLVEFYLENKMEKELDKSFNLLFKL